MKRKILLVNTNLMQPPIAPLGLDYLAVGLQRAGFKLELLDCCLAETDPATFIASFDLLSPDYLLISATVRNIDDSYSVSRDFCLPAVKQILDLIRDVYRRAGVPCPPLVLGGIGFSIFPEATLHFCQADFGIIGDAELSLVQLAETLATSGTSEALVNIPGLFVRTPAGQYRLVKPPLYQLPPFQLSARALVDNLRYFQRGGQLGFETKRGCPHRCAYCADPVARGQRLRLRDPREIADELMALAERGITHFHTCDCEFNLDRQHVIAICEELIRRNAGEKIRWYAYCLPVPFDEEPTRLLQAAGCAGIDFTVDSLNQCQLQRLNHLHRAEDVASAVKLCRQYGIATMIDLLLGAPGETRDTIRETLQRAADINPDAVGISLGVRLYPHTPLWNMVKQQAPPHQHPGVSGWSSPPDTPDAFALLRPVYYLEPTLGTDIAEYISELIAGDRRFMFGGAGTSAVDYNYNQNHLLLDALQRGYRGAYWHILQQVS